VPILKAGVRSPDPVAENIVALGTSDLQNGRAMRRSVLATLKRNAYLRFAGALLLVVATAPTFGLALVQNIGTLFRGPDRLSFAQLQNHLAQSGTSSGTLVDSVKYVVLPKLAATSAGFGVRRGEEELTDFRYLFVGNAVLVAESDAGAELLTAGELRPLEGKPKAFALTQVSRLGKNVRLAPYLLDSTANVQEKLRLLSAASTFLLSLVVILFIRCLLRLRDPLRHSGLRDIEQCIEIDETVGSLTAAVRTRRVDVAEHALLFRGLFVLKIVDLGYVIWVRERTYAGRRLLDVKSIDGSSTYFPLRRRASLTALYERIRAVNPIIAVGDQPRIERLWSTNRDGLCRGAAQLQEIAWAAWNNPEADDETEAIPTLTEIVSGTPLNARGQSFAQQRSFMLREFFTGRGGALRSSAVGSMIAAFLVISPTPFLHSASADIRTVADDSISWSKEIKPLAEFVERTRGAKFKHAVPVDLLSPAAYDAVSGNVFLLEPAKQGCASSGINPVNPRLANAEAVSEADLCAVRGNPADLRRIAFELLGMRKSIAPKAEQSGVRKHWDL
jgi:hypothetical protein